MLQKKQFIINDVISIIYKFCASFYLSRNLRRSASVKLLNSDQINFLVLRLELLAFRDFLLEVKDFVEEILQLEMERIHSLLGCVGRVPRVPGAQFIQSVQLLQGEKVERG